MAKQLQLRRGTTVQHNTFTGAVGEVTIDTDKDVVVVHDGATAGGFPSQKELVSGTNIKTVNSTTLLGSGNIAVQETLVSGTNIKTINNSTILGSGNIDVVSAGMITGGTTNQVLAKNSNTDYDTKWYSVQEPLVSGTNIKTVNSTSLLGSGDVAVPQLSGVTAYHLLEGSLALASTTPTSGFSTTLYTGNGSTQSIDTGVDMATQWGSDSSETYGGLVWYKQRSGTDNHYLYDTIRGATNRILSNLTNAQDSTSGLTAFTSTGWTTGASGNANLATYASWNFQTTHRTSGTTNHGKAYTCHYNPFTGFTIVKYEGSGIAGHEIPHMLGRKLGFVTIKNLSAVADWMAFKDDSNYLLLNLTNAQASTGVTSTILSDTSFIPYNNGVGFNASTNTYIMYGWANSYFDATNTLIGNYEIGVYQGTGAAGNKVTTRGKPAWLMIKRLDASDNWVMFDNMRPSTAGYTLYPNLSNAEETVKRFDFVSDGFVSNTNTERNVSGGQYLYMVVYDNDSGSGKSKYPKPADAPVINLTAKVPFANGVDVNGTKLSILSKNESISGVTLSQGKNYVYCDNTGAYGKSIHRPRYLASDLVRTYAGEQPDYYDVKSNKWFNTDAGSELVTNGTFDSGISGWTVANGTLSETNGVMTLTGTGGGIPRAYYVIETEIGKKIRVSANINTGTYNIYSSELQVSSMISTDPRQSLKISSLSNYVSGYFEFIAQQTTYYVYATISSTSAGHYGQFDNISVFEADIVPTTEISESRNYMNHIVYADNDGSPLYVEELPKMEYKDIIKANEYRGKNACTAWVNFDGTTTPPTIRNSYNVSSVVRTATGIFDIYFINEMDNSNYAASGLCRNEIYPDWRGMSIGQNYINKITIFTDYISTTNGSSSKQNLSINQIQIFGGKK